MLVAVIETGGSQGITTIGEISEVIMANGFEGSVSGFGYVIDRRNGMSCLLCRATDRSLLFRKDEPTEAGWPSRGICEPCSHQLGWAWRQLAGEVPPGFSEEDLRRVSTACVLISRRREIPKLDASPEDGEQIIKAPAELNSSYEFLLAPNPDGTCSVPSLSMESHPETCACEHCGPHRGEATRPVLSLLSSLNLRTCPALLEPLYTAYSPRGRLVGVTLARGWSEILNPLRGTVQSPQSALVWRPWPLSEHTGDMAGFWRTMETIWALRLYKHCAVEDAGDLCVHLREAAWRYIELQAAVRSRQPVDASMLSVYRAAMSVDEVAIDRLIQLAENRVRDERSLAVIPRAEVELSKQSPSDGAGRTVLDRKWDSRHGEIIQNPTEDEESPPDGGWNPLDSGDDDETDSGDDQPDSLVGESVDSNSDSDPSFVRPRRPLRQIRDEISLRDEETTDAHDK